jgi:hypothetical protein
MDFKIGDIISIYDSSEHCFKDIIIEDIKNNVKTIFKSYITSAGGVRMDFNILFYKVL